jgi:thymidine kinase
MSGKLTVIIGPMFAAKSTTLIAKCRRLMISKKKCIMIRHPFDIRYDGHEDNVVTHDGVQCAAKTSPDKSSIMKLTDELQDYDAIFIDEGQFYDDIADFCDHMANNGKLVFCSGLYADANRIPFGPMTYLLAVADDIIFQTAVDPVNGADAPFTDFAAAQHGEQQIQVGGAELYRPCSRATYRMSPPHA